MSKKAINNTVELINLFWQLEKEDMESGEPDKLCRYHNAKLAAIEVLHTLGEEVEYNAQEESYELLEEVYEYGYEENAPCDTYGTCAGTYCKRYYQCHR